MTAHQTERRKKRLCPRTLAAVLIGNLGLLLPTNSDGAAFGAVQQLMVKGKLNGGQRVITRDLIDQIGSEELHTDTPFTDSPATFRGVPLARLIEAIGAYGEDVSAYRRDSHSVGFSLNEAIEKGAFIAYARDGVDLSSQTQGPFWIVFPWSERPGLNTHSVEAMALRQLNRLVIQ